jgi:PhnB protein
MKIRPYFTFKGQCQEAIDLYSNAFKTKASEVMRFSDLPKNPERVIPESQKNWILQATIPFLGSVINQLKTLFPYVPFL